MGDAEDRPGACRVCNRCRTLFVAGTSLQSITQQITTRKMCVDWCKNCHGSEYSVAGHQFVLDQLRNTIKYRQDESDQGDIYHEDEDDYDYDPAPLPDDRSYDRDGDERMAKSLGDHMEKQKKFQEKHGLMDRLKNAWARANSPSSQGGGRGDEEESDDDDDVRSQSPSDYASEHDTDYGSGYDTDYGSGYATDDYWDDDGDRIKLDSPYDPWKDKDDWKTD